MISCKLNIQRGKYNQTKPSFCARFKVLEVLMLYCATDNLTYPNILKNHSSCTFKGWQVLEGLPTLEDEGATSLRYVKIC